jgi:hypothetical protein
LPKFTGSTTIGNSLVFDDGTNVGINTASPEGKLTVVGTSAQPPTSGTTANSLLQLKGSLSNELNIGSNTVAGNYGAYIQASDNNLAIPYQLNLQPTGGNVIIGGYTDAGFKLDVNGTGRFLSSASGGQTLRLQTTVSAGRNYVQWVNPSGDMGYIGYGGADGKFYINNQLNDDMLFYTNSALRLTIASTGAATFSNSVTVKGDLVSNAGAGATYFIMTSAGAGDGLGVLYNSSSVAKIQLYTNGASYFNGGNFLIGTTTDNGYKLQVNGTSYFNDTVNIGSTEPIPTFTAPNGGKLLMLSNVVIVSGVIAFGSPYSQNIQIDIAYNNWGGNNVIGLVDMIITLREFANVSGTAFGKVFATNSGSGSTFASFNTSNVTTSQCSVTASSGGSYTLRITIDPSSITDRGSFYLTIPNAGGTGSTINSITISYV